LTRDYTNPRLPKNERNVPVPRDELDFDHPPRGITMERTCDGGVVIRVRLFTLLGLLGMIFVVLFWNGIVSIFIVENITDTAALLARDECAGDGWARSFAIVGIAGRWLFMTPFIAIGVFLVLYFFVFLFGGCVVRLGADGRGSVCTGIGRVGWTRRFETQFVKAVRAHITVDPEENTSTRDLRIELSNGRNIKFPGISNMHEAWLVFAMRKILKIPHSQTHETP
jgi:hypothetical protein